MKKCWLVAIVTLFFSAPLFANQQTDTSFTETTIILHTAKGDISGTLTVPDSIAQPTAMAITP
jgi:hypothetical protein